ncbi:dephospho-CoA kinase [Methylobacterium oryzae]|uniref:dephospho-CoA kinase n=1 Tax=Methylobacterium oryzae TaxID=334852 RepID=UPI002F2E8D38
MSGATPRAFVVGHPIAHSRSPLIHGHWLAEHGIPGSYERLDVRPAAFPDFVRGLPDSGFRGGNVTIPHKETAFALVDTLTPRARAIGAVNTLVVAPDGRIRGDNTDAPGFCAHLDQTLGAAWPDRAGGTALVLGAGGAAGAAFPGVLGDGGGVDRARLRAAVLDAPDRMAALEAIVHPLVRAASADFLARHAAAPLVVLDIPLLYETGGEGRCDAVAVVSAPPEIQRARVLARPGMTEAAFAAILAKQMPDAEKRARADFVIDTGRGFPAAEAEVARLVARLTAHRAPPHRGDG